jgi:D-alanyl-lipoteichoic acid acyltransferase DltB (MBOAT superfamily)
MFDIDNTVNFNDFYNKLYDMIYYSDFYNCMPIGEGSRESFISTISIGFISNIRVFETKEKKQEQFIKMFKSMINVFKTYIYGANDYNNISFIDWLGKFFESRVSLKDKNEEILELIPEIVENIYSTLDIEYYNVQKNIDKLFNSKVSWHNQSHEDHINYMTFITMAFLDSVSDRDNKKDITLKYLKNLYEFIRDDELCVYDNYDYKHNIINI